jgi:Fur family transcriptional regulator, ferric uptake regulator
MLYEDCISGGLKMTVQRRIIADCLDEADDHPDVDAIYRRAVEKDPSVSIATVYRTIGIFEKAGLIEPIDIVDSNKRYEVKRERHDHLVDVETGQIHEFKSTKIENAVREIALEMGFDVSDFQLQVYGSKVGGKECPCYRIKIY